MPTRFDEQSFDGFLASERWFLEQSARAKSGLENSGLSAFMEMAFAPAEAMNKTQIQLLDAAHSAQIFTFGWPIGLIFDDEFRPSATRDGILAEVRGNERGRNSYDYWAIRNTGDFYSLISLFEDTRVPGSIYFDTRIIRTTEALLYCHRLYTNLGLNADSKIGIYLKHKGLRGRALTAASPRRFLIPKTTQEDEAESQVVVSLGSLSHDIKNHVQTLLAPLFVLFESTTIDRAVYDEIIGNFIDGRII